MNKTYLCAFLSCVTLVLTACGSSSEDTGTTTNGVNDVSKACATRASWTRETSPKCIECIAFAKVPRCECQDEEYAGACSTQQSAKNNEPSCEGVDVCVNRCAATDCICVDSCYAGKDTCRPLGAATDGCLTATCDAYCR
ncbi:hypothetical protein LZC95_07490 [Pendulispora brunnea]|uniref:Lipoprotein n=1 Tax=Pendulispora brunnea TaxID=2905690 RepID=A0ABZ2KDA3_9BACT